VFFCDDDDDADGDKKNTLTMYVEPVWWKEIFQMFLPKGLS